MNYDELLERAVESMPKKVEQTERFEIPKSVVQRDGAKTIITNFVDIANGLRRETAHLLKFILKELATKGVLEKNRLTVLGRFTAEHVDKKIELYVKEFVICPVCTKPDTKMVKKDRFYFLECEACGAKHSLGLAKV